MSSLTPRSDLTRLISSSKRLALDAAHDVAEHLHEAPVGVPREALVLGLRGQTLHRLVVEAEVQDGVEHARHRLARTRAHGDEQRVLGVAELLAGALLERRQRLVDLLVEAVGEAVLAHVGDARLGRDREPARHPVGAQDARHLRDVGALAAKELAHVPRALGELVDPFRRHPAGDPTGPRRGASGFPRGARACRRSRARPGAARARRRAASRPAAGRWRRPGRRAPPAPAGTSPPRRPWHTTPPAAPENPLRCSRSPHEAHAASCGARPAASRSLRRKASWLACPARAGSAVEQRELVAEQVVDAGMRLGGVEQAPDRVARARGGVERAAVLAQARIARDGLGRGHGEQVAAPLVQDEVEAEERLEPAAEAAARAAHALGDRAHLAALRGIQVQDAVGLAVAQRAQDDALDLHRAGHDTPAILCEVMAKITVYSTEPCSFCERAKQLLKIRELEFDEINLAKDPAGRAQLVEETGMLSFPQIVDRRGRASAASSSSCRPTRAAAWPSSPRRPPSAPAPRARLAALARVRPAPRGDELDHRRRRSAGTARPRRRWTRNSFWKAPRTPSAWRKSSIVAPPAARPACSASRTATAQRVALRAREAARRAQRVDARAEERLVGVDVARRPRCAAGRAGRP